MHCENTVVPGMWFAMYVIGCDHYQYGPPQLANMTLYKSLRPLSRDVYKLRYLTRYYSNGLSILPVARYSGV